MIPNDTSEHKERLAALLPITAASVLANARLLRKPKERTVHQRCKLSPWDLQWGPEATCLRSRLRMREAYRAKPTYGARAFAQRNYALLAFSRISD